MSHGRRAGNLLIFALPVLLIVFMFVDAAAALSVRSTGVAEQRSTSVTRSCTTTGLFGTDRRARRATIATLEIAPASTPSGFDRRRAGRPGTDRRRPQDAPERRPPHHRERPRAEDTAVAIEPARPSAADASSPRWPPSLHRPLRPARRRCTTWARRRRLDAQARPRPRRAAPSMILQPGRRRQRHGRRTDQLDQARRHHPRSASTAAVSPRPRSPPRAAATSSSRVPGKRRPGRRRRDRQDRAAALPPVLRRRRPAQAAEPTADPTPSATATARPQATPAPDGQPSARPPRATSRRPTGRRLRGAGGQRRDHRRRPTPKPERHADPSARRRPGRRRARRPASRRPTGQRSTCRITPAIEQQFTALDCKDPEQVEAIVDDPDKPMVTCSATAPTKYDPRPGRGRRHQTSDASAGAELNQQGQPDQWLEIRLTFNARAPRSSATSRPAWWRCSRRRASSRSSWTAWSSPHPQTNAADHRRPGAASPATSPQTARATWPTSSSSAPCRCPSRCRRRTTSARSSARDQLTVRPARRRDRPAARGPLLAVPLPRPGPGHRRLAARRRGDHLRRGRAAGLVARLPAHHGRHHRPDRRHRHHRRLVHRLLRTDAGRGPRGPSAARRRRHRLEARPAHDPDRRRGQHPGCRRALRRWPPATCAGSRSRWC